MAIPRTSATSQAAIATSAKRYKMKFMDLGDSSLFACARSLPLTIPHLADSPWKSKAIKLLINKTQISV